MLTQRPVISNIHLYIVTSAIWLFTATLIQIIFLKIIHRSGYFENIANIHTLFQLFLFSFDKHNSVGWQRGPWDCVRSEPRQAGRKLDEILRNAARAVAISCMPIFMRAPTLKKKKQQLQLQQQHRNLMTIVQFGRKKTICANWGSESSDKNSTRKQNRETSNCLLWDQVLAKP